MDVLTPFLPEEVVGCKSVRGRGTRFGIDGAIRNILLRLLVAADNAAMPTEPSKAEPPKRQRRWFQVHLESAEHDDDATKEGEPVLHAFS